MESFPDEHEIQQPQSQRSGLVEQHDGDLALPQGAAPKAIPYQQVDFEFVTRKDYGINVPAAQRRAHQHARGRQDRRPYDHDVEAVTPRSDFEVRK
jgi:hypothetical protein